MIIFPNCKINLGLNIIRKRNDGFHDLETIFYPVQWRDALEIIESDEMKMELAGIPVPGKPEDNLCLKAYHLLKHDYDIPPVHIFLLKNIPMGAGLGGGSADGAFMLKLLTDKFELPISPDQMKEYAKQLGSDCAFFIYNKPIFASGKGDIFEETAIDLTGKYIFLVYPSIAVNTGWAYGMIAPEKPEKQIRDIIKEPISQWQEQLINDFEVPVFKEYPVLREIKEVLLAHGAEYAAMSGSGSTIYGIFSSPDPFNTLKNIFGKYRTFSSSL